MNEGIAFEAAWQDLLRAFSIPDQPSLKALYRQGWNDGKHWERAENAPEPARRQS